jgi:hypothetical protein
LRGSCASDLEAQQNAVGEMVKPISAATRRGLIEAAHNAYSHFALRKR